MLKRFALALIALVAVTCALPSLAATPSRAQVYHAAHSGQMRLGQAPLRVLATRTVRAGRHSIGLLLVLVGAAGVVWLVLRRRAVSMGYLQHPGQYPGQYPGSPPPGAPPGGYGVASYPGGYMPGGGSGVTASVASGVTLGAGVAAGEEPVERGTNRGSNPSEGFVPPAESDDPGS